MRSRVSPFSVYGLIVLLVYTTAAPVAFAGQDNRTWKEKARDAASSSAASIGVELAVKYVGGFLHDTMCKPPSNDDTAKFLCDVVGGISGRSEQEWKDRVDRKLTEINTKLDTLAQGQTEIKNAIAKLDTTLNYEFDNAAPRQKAFNILSNIDTLWTSYTRLIKGKYLTDKNELLDFANKVAFQENLDGELGKLSTVIEKPILDAESVLRYPYVKWQKLNPGLHHYNFDPTKIYDVAEKKYMDLRMYQQKGYLMYLFAAEVLEARCEMDPPNCRRPPTSSKRFHDDFQANMRDQLAAYNAALDWFVLAYSAPHYGEPSLSLPDGSLNAITRANYLSMTLSGRKGMWGRVYSMGNKWTPAASLKCGNSDVRMTQSLLDYKVPVEDSTGTLDWWTSSANNAVYDEVRFSKEWRVVHFNADRGAGPCALQTAAQGIPGVLPWAQADSEIIEVPGPDSKPMPFGSFLAVQRAGGTYALVSGEWGGHGEPWKEEGGDAVRKDIRWEWHIDRSHKYGPQLSLYYGGRGEWNGGDTKVYRYNIIHAWNKKRIRFPEDTRLKLHLGQSTDCAKVCRNNRSVESILMDYNIENSSGDAGYLHALTGIYLHPDGGDSKSTGYGAQRSRMANGIFIDGSYSDAKNSVTKTKTVEGDQSADIAVDSSKQYQFQLMIDMQLVTYTKGWNAVNFWYRTKVTPYAVYLTRK